MAYFGATRRYLQGRTSRPTQPGWSMANESLKLLSQLVSCFRLLRVGQEVVDQCPSATLRVSARTLTSPSDSDWGSMVTRPLCILRPKRVQQDAGIRIDPPPSWRSKRPDLRRPPPRSRCGTAWRPRRLPRVASHAPRHRFGEQMHAQLGSVVFPTGMARSAENVNECGIALSNHSRRTHSERRHLTSQVMFIFDSERNPQQRPGVPASSQLVCLISLTQRRLRSSGDEGVQRRIGPLDSMQRERDKLAPSMNRSQASRVGVPAQQRQGPRVAPWFRLPTTIPARGRVPFTLDDGHPHWRSRRIVYRSGTARCADIQQGSGCPSTMLLWVVKPKFLVR